MRRNARNILLGLVCWFAGLMPLRAATDLNPETHHFIGLWGNMAYYGLLTNMEEAKVLNGFSPALGFGYRYYRNGFIMQMGVEAQYGWSANAIGTMEQTMMMYDADTNNEPFQLTATLSDRQERYHSVGLNIPLFFGYEKHRFYLLAGVVGGIHLYGVAKTTATFTTVGEYTRYIGLFEDMPNHGLTTKEVESGKKKFSMRNTLMAHVEMGARLEPFSAKTGFNVRPHYYRLYLGAFVNYGLFDSYENRAIGNMMDLDFSQGVNAVIVPMLMSNQMQNKKVHPLTVGVKFTVMFELPQKGKSFIYDYDKANQNFRKRGGNQSIKQ